MIGRGGQLPRHLDEFDIALEHVIDQFGEVHALGGGLGGQLGLRLLILLQATTVSPQPVSAAAACVKPCAAWPW